MKINPKDARDRYELLTSQEFSIGDCCQDLINQKPFGDVPFYIFVHPRTEEDGATKRLIWQARLTRPKAQTNSMLFKAMPNSNEIRVIWMIPERALWDQYTRGKLTQNKTVFDSINNFLNNRELLEAKEPDDLPDEDVDRIYREISEKARNAKLKAPKPA